MMVNVEWRLYPCNVLKEKVVETKKLLNSNRSKKLISDLISVKIIPAGPGLRSEIFHNITTGHQQMITRK